MASRLSLEAVSLCSDSFAPHWAELKLPGILIKCGDTDGPLTNLASRCQKRPSAV